MSKKFLGNIPRASKSIVGLSVSDKKQINPKVLNGSTDNLNFKWRVDKNYLDLKNPNYGWNLKADELLNIAISGLQDFEKYTWSQVKQREHSHYIKLQYLKTKHRNLYNYIIEHKLEEPFQVDIQQKERVIGYRRQDILFLIWYDPKHQIYPSKKS